MPLGIDLRLGLYGDPLLAGCIAGLFLLYSEYGITGLRLVFNTWVTQHKINLLWSAYAHNGDIIYVLRGQKKVNIKIN